MSRPTSDEESRVIETKEQHHEQPSRFYQAEIDYRREVLRREWRPIRARRAARTVVRNQIARDK